MEQSLPSALTQIQWVDALNALSLAMFGVNGTVEISSFYPNAKAAEAGRNAAMASTTWMTKFMEGGTFFNANMNRTAIIRIA